MSSYFFLLQRKALFCCRGFSSDLIIFHSYGDYYQWRAQNFDLWLALMAIVQWGFISVPHLLWHGASVYNGHLQRSVTHTHTCYQEFISGAVTTCIYDLGLSQLRFAHALTDCAIDAACCRNKVQTRKPTFSFLITNRRNVCQLVCRAHIGVPLPLITDPTSVQEACFKYS